MKQTYKNGLTALWLIILIALPIIVSVIALCIGTFEITPGDILSSLFSKITGEGSLNPRIEYILWDNRLPRILLALLVGAGLSISGCAFQSLFANPLATPDTLGVASGASFGAALALLFGFSFLGIQLFSMAMGLLAVVLTVISGTGRSKHSFSGVVLGGIMIGSLFSALIALVKYTADTESQLPAIEYWLMGSFNSASYESLAVGAIPIIFGITVLLLLRWRMNLVVLSDDEAISSGVNIKILRAVIIVCATMITASCVSMSGQVGWIGLLVPHMCRMKFGNNHTSILPASALFGAGFMVVVDTLARTISSAGLPLSVLTAIIGAPFFILLMRKTNGLGN
ncbi:MAG: iron ABC transporter permease [Clostridia bacterium]|nr:iron ABC transporter permease [Clostridia bacterium]